MTWYSLAHLSILMAGAASGAADPVHQALITRIDAIRLELKAGKTGVPATQVGEIDAQLDQAIENIHQADAYSFSQHGGAPKAAASAGEADNDTAAESQDVAARLADIKDDLKDYKRGKWGGFVGKAEKELGKAINIFRNATAKPRMALVPTTARQPWPSVDYAHFLPTSTDPAHRQLLWTYLFYAERAAHTFAATPDAWVPLKSVQLTAGQRIAGEWSTKGTITLKGDDGPGTLFHEIFHTAFHRSVFHQPHDGRWTEGFCDAFRYAAEQEFMQPPKSNWTTKLDSLTTKTFEQAAAHGGGHWLSHYGYPAALIVKRSGGTMAGLHALWLKLQQLKAQRGGRDVFNDTFGFVIKGKGE